MTEEGEEAGGEKNSQLSYKCVFKKIWYSSTASFHSFDDWLIICMCKLIWCIFSLCSWMFIWSWFYCTVDCVTLSITLCFQMSRSTYLLSVRINLAFYKNMSTPTVLIPKKVLKTNWVVPDDLSVDRCVAEHALEGTAVSISQHARSAKLLPCTKKRSNKDRTFKEYAWELTCYC